MAPWPFMVLAGTFVGVLMGIFGVGGSSVATPLLALLGVPPLIAVATPLIATVEANVVERFTGAGVPEEKISFARDTYSFIYPEAPSALLAAFRTYYGPTMNAFEAAEANGRTADLQNELDALFNSQNTSPSSATTSIPATFLRVMVAC